jgi:chemotaxis protein CheZ
MTPDWDLSSLKHAAGKLGGELERRPGRDGSEWVRLRFPADPETRQQLKRLLSLGDPEAVLERPFDALDPGMEEVLRAIKEFMRALAAREMDRAQEILLSLSQDKERGLYQEIGTLARELHDSLRNFLTTLDPTLKEIVEDRIPDSGHRLEHIIELTENAANTTLDHVETLQKRNDTFREKLVELRRQVLALHAFGDPAREKLEQMEQLLAAMDDSAARTRDDLITLLTAQDYQDITGQIIMKIITLLREMESKLVHLITSFGVRPNQPREVPEEQLYGPAHKSREAALHSQNDVDAMLAEFGF